MSAPADSRSTSQIATTPSPILPPLEHSQLAQPQAFNGWQLSGCLFLFVSLVAAVFGQSVTYDFVNWDDPWYVLNNPLISQWSWSNLYGIATQTVTRNYAPVTIFSYLLDRTAWGYWPGGYHLTNLLLHAINSWLVFLVVRQVTGRSNWAWLTAILFAVHPVQIESVVWISARKGLLSALFMLISLKFWLRPERQPGHEMWGTLFYVVALLCKAVAVIVPGIVFVYDWIVCKKSFAEALSRQFVGGLLAIWFVLLTAGSQQTVGGGIRHHFSLSKLEILGLDSVLLWRYLGMLVFPFERSILYDPPITGIAIAMLFSSLFWLGLAIWLWRRRGQKPLLVFACAVTLAPLVPVLNLFPLTTIINDRYLYLPCIPIFVMMIAGLESGFKSILKSASVNSQQRVMRLAQISVAVCGLVAAVCCCRLTTAQLPIWKNDLALWSNAAQVAPELPVVQYQKAIALWNNEQPQLAIEHIDRALQLSRLDQIDRERFESKRLLYLEQMNGSADLSQTGTK